MEDTIKKNVLDKLTVGMLITVTRKVYNTTDETVSHVEYDKPAIIVAKTDNFVTVQYTHYRESISYYDLIDRTYVIKIIGGNNENINSL